MYDHRSTSVVPTIDAAFTTANPPAPGVPPTAYWGRWTGFIRFPVGGRFAFTLPLGMRMTLATSSGTEVPMTTQHTTRSTNIAVIANTDYRLTVSTNIPLANFSMRWRSLGGTPAVPDTIVPTTALRPAVVPGSVPAAYVDPVIARQVDVRWTAVGGATGYQVARGGEVATVDYRAPLTGTTLQTAVERTDPNSLEAQPVVYAIKAGFPNPVTGGTTLSAPALAGAIVPGTMKLAVAGTAAGELTLFWNGRFSAGGGFRVFESPTFGTLGTLMTPTPVTTVNPKPDLQEAYLHVLTNRPLNEERYYTVVAVDSSGNETARSDQEPGDAMTLGLPWRSTNPADVTEALRTRLQLSFSGFDDLNGFTITGPDGSRYVRDENGSTVFRSAFDSLANQPGEANQDGERAFFQNPARVERGGTQPRVYINKWKKNEAGVYRKAEAGPGKYGLYAVLNLPTTVQLRSLSNAYVYAGGSIRRTQNNREIEFGHIDMGMFRGFKELQLNSYWRLFANTGADYAFGNPFIVIPKFTQAKDRKIPASYNGPLALDFVSLDCAAPGSFPDVLLLDVRGLSGAFTGDDGTPRSRAVHVAFRSGWRWRNREGMIMKRTNSIAQRDEYSPGFGRFANVYATGERVVHGSWGIQGDPSGIQLYPNGTMDDSTILGIGNVPAGNEQTVGSGGTPSVITGFDVASCVVRDRFFAEDLIHLQTRR